MIDILQGSAHANNKNASILLYIIKTTYIFKVNLKTIHFQRKCYSIIILQHYKLPTYVYLASLRNSAVPVPNRECWRGILCSLTPSATMKQVQLGVDFSHFSPLLERTYRHIVRRPSITSCSAFDLLPTFYQPFAYTNVDCYLLLLSWFWSSCDLLQTNLGIDDTS